MLCVWPDIAVSLVSRYQSNLGLADWQAFKRIKSYLYGIVNLVFCYQEGDLKLRGYVNANWHDDRDGSRSTSRYAFTFGGKAMSWSNKKQNYTIM